MENYRRIVGENVRAARKALGWSQEDLAFETDIDRTYISGIERGIRNPSLDMLVVLARRLKITPAALLTPAAGESASQRKRETARRK
jgi:transcriptional regulator with XRE-family HTH domain